jgi:transposase
MSSRWGATLPRQSMADWIRITSEWLEPIYRAMIRSLLDSGYVQVDETPVKCNDPDEKRGGTTQGYLWVMSRPGGDVVFDWRLSRRHGELTHLLTEDYQGILQSDGYEAYASYVKNRPAVTWVACWAHARRKYFEAQAESPKAARVALKLIARLYRLEREWDGRGIEPIERAALRKTHFARSLKWLRALALQLRERMRPQSLLGNASNYLLSHWEPLTAHLDHGQTKLDTNVVENAIRPSVIGRKNWLFIGHPDAGQRSAIIYSIVVSCQRHGKDPLAYLRDVLTRLPTMSNQDDLAPLLPINWQPA